MCPPPPALSVAISRCMEHGRQDPKIVCVWSDAVVVVAFHLIRRPLRRDTPKALKCFMNVTNSVLHIDLHGEHNDFIYSDTMIRYQMCDNQHLHNKIPLTHTHIQTCAWVFCIKREQAYNKKHEKKRNLHKK